MDSIVQDLRYAIRTLAKAPGFTATAVLTLALGIGASTTVFTVVEKLILNPLPFPHADRIVSIWLRDSATGIGVPPAFSEEVALRQNAHTLDAFDLINSRTWYSDAGGEPEMLDGAAITPSLLRTLGVPPTIGRLLVDGDSVTGAPRVAMLGERFWRRRFGGRLDVVGQSIQLDSVPYTIIGVAPERLAALESWRPFDVWVPLRTDELTMDPTITAKLRTGVTPEQARADLSAVLAAERAVHPAQGFRARSTIDVHTEGGLGKSTTRTAVLVLAGAVVVLLLIGCANVASLLLARATRRQREIAIRRALGAGRGRLIRQLLTEGLVLSLGAAALGLLLVQWMTSVFVTFHPRFLYQMEHLTIDGRVLGFAIIASVGTTLLFAIVPALQATSFELQDALKGMRSRGPRALSVQRTFVTIELALTGTLLFGGSLLVQSLRARENADPGFRPDEMVAVEITLPRARFPTDAATPTFWRALLDRARTVSGVSDLLLADDPIPGAGPLIGTTIEVEGATLSTGEQSTLLGVENARPGYFATLGIPILAGRGFTDDEYRLEKDVAVINTSMAKALAPTGSALGMRFRYSPREAWKTVVGVIRDDPPVLSPGFGYPLWQVRQPVAETGYEGERHGWLVARYRPGVRPGGLLATLRGVVHQTDSTVIVSTAAATPDLLSARFADARFIAILLSSLAGLALAIAGVGLFGVLSYVVAQRTREIGIRIALGAETGSVVGMVVRQGLIPTAIGLAAGVCAGIFLSRFFAALLYHTPRTDPVTIGAVVTVLAVTTLAASVVPARRAASVDPLVALRSE